MGIEVPIGPSGLAALMPALTAALAGTGPAVALMPGSGSAEYRARIAAAVQPGVDVPAGVAAVIATSGSTGDPAGVLLPGSALRAAAEAFTQLRADTAGAGVQADAGGAGTNTLTFGHRWVAALPLHHAGGFMVAVRAAVAGTTPIGLASLGGGQPFSVAAFAEATEQAVAASARDARPLAVSLVPPMLALLDDAGPTGRLLLTRYDAVLVGGAATPGPLVDRLRAAGVHVLRSYGMTETCGGAVFDGQPLPGVTVRCDPAGRLTICGLQVAAGYRDGREPDRWQATTDGAGGDAGRGTGTRCFLTSDLGQVGEDGLVRVRGRVDDVVQVGGASVSLAAVRAALLTDPHVVDAEVVAVAHDRFGVTIAAFVVPADSPATGASSPIHPASGQQASGLSSDELADSVALQLGAAARPRLVQVVDRLPMLAAGKPDRRALLNLASRALEAASGPATHDRIRP